MEIRRIKYPCDIDSEDENAWYKFGSRDGAVSIPNYEIEDWINQSIKSVKEQLENGVESPYSFMASGDTIVICFFSQDCEEDTFDDYNYFTVIVAKNYEEGTFTIKDIKKDEKDDNQSTIDILEQKIDMLQHLLIEERRKNNNWRL